MNRQVCEQVSGTGVSAMRFDYAYTDRGQLEFVTRYSNLAGTATVALRQYEYGDARRMVVLTHVAGTMVLANYTYTYDAADRLTAKTEGGGEKAKTRANEPTITR
jgi:hypothetical protein